MNPELNEPSIPAIADIVLVARIRETSQAIWYRARQIRLGRDVLLKLRPLSDPTAQAGSQAPAEKTPPSGSPGASEPAGAPRRAARKEEAELARAREEMLLLSRLQCDGIAAAFNAEVQAGWVIQIVELPTGEPLTRILQDRKREPWPVGDALGIAADILRALDHAHQAGVILCRIHPEDIFLSPDGRVKIASLEWAIGPGKRHVLPPDPHWTAPECTTGGTLGPAADLYALGLLIAWLLTGKEPSASGLRLASEKALEALRAQGVRADVTALVTKLLEPSPENRFSSAAAMDAVRMIQEALHRRPLPARAAAAAALALVLILGLAFQFLVIPALKKPPAAEDGKAPAAGSAPEGAPKEPVAAGTEDPDPGDAKAAAEKAIQEKAIREKAAEEKLLEEIRSDWTAKGRAEVDASARGDIPDLMAKGRFKAAADLLEALAGRFPLEAGRIGQLRADLRARQEEAIRALEAEVDGHIRAGRLDDAQQRITSVCPLLGLQEGTAARETLTARVTAERQERSRIAEKVARSIAAARDHIEAQRFDAAEAALALQEAPEDLAAPLALVRRELWMARAALDAVLKGLGQAIESKAALRTRILDPAAGTWHEAEGIILDGRDGASLAAHRKGSTASLHFTWYDLEPSTLEALAGPAAAGADFKEGLLILLLGARRTEPALGMLEDPSFPRAPRARYTERLRIARGRRLGDLAEGMEKERSALVGQKKTPPEAWASLRDTAGRCISRSFKEPCFAEHRSRLEESFLFAAREALRPREPENLFRGRFQREARDGTVRVIYDFRDPGEARDWIPLAGGSSLKRAGDTALLRGAVRLLGGDPFGPRMRALVLIPPKAHSKLSSLGLILGSKAAEGPQAAGMKEAPGKGLAFVLGYTADSGTVEVKAEPSSMTVGTPAHVLFACAGPLPKMKEAIWAAPGRIPPAAASSLLIQAQVGPSLILWTLNGKPVLSERGEMARKHLAIAGLSEPGPSSGGSLTLAAGGGEVFIESIEVVGVLREAWIEERLGQLARAELARFYASLESQKAQSAKK